MAIRILPFGAFEGFSDQPVGGAHYYSQGISPSYFGGGSQFSIINKANSSSISGMGNIKGFAKGPGGAIFAQDDAGNILKEATPGQFDFSIVRSPGGNGSGIMGDQYGNLLYANGASNNQLGLYDGSSWTDNFESLTVAQHPMDTYEDLRLIANKNGLAVLFSDGSYNNSAFTLPSSMTIVAVKGGPTGIIIGANLGYRSAIIIWDGFSPSAKYPWKWRNGQILSIDTYGENWVVKTTRETLITNGVTVKQLFGVFDDPLSFRTYDSTNVLPQQMLVVNNSLVFLITSQANGPLTYEFGKMKPGLYVYSLTGRVWNYYPVPTGNMIGLDMNSVFADVNFNNRILIGYRDHFFAENFIAELTPTPPASAVLVTEELGLGHVRYTRGGLFGPTDKSAEALILNLAPHNATTDPATLTFNVALKLYNFKRQLWGHAVTNASLSSNKNKLQIDGTSAANYDAQVGDEVTILEGVNAGAIAHITAIANDGLSNETWTLDTTFGTATENAVYLQVQPFTLVKKQTFSGLASLKNLYFSINSIKGKQFLAKLVIDGMGTNLAVEMQTSYFVMDDLGYDQT